MLRRFIVWFAGPLVVGVLGCNIIESTGVPEVTRLTVHLDLAPDSVAPGDTLRAEARVVNQGHFAATLVTEAECFATISLFRDEEEQTFQSDPPACWTLSSPLTLEPGDTLAQHWSIATVHDDDTPFEEATYQVYLDVAARLDKGSPIPDIMSTFKVTEQAAEEDDDQNGDEDSGT